MPDHQPTAHSETVLVADDSSASRFLLQSLLSDWGYPVVTASDGFEAWRILGSEQAPKLALIDWMMPGMDGIELCRRVRQQSTFVYLVLVTSRNATDDLVEGLDAGADDFIAKPIQPAELRSRLAVGQRILNYQLQLADRNEQLNTLFAAIPDAICFKDASGHWLKANQATLRLFRLGNMDYRGRSDGDLAREPGALNEVLRRFGQSDEAAYRSGKVFREELESAETNRVFEVIKAPIFGADERRKGMIAIGRDITHRKQLELQLREEARIDVLTGVLTRRHLDLEVQKAIDAALSQGLSVSLCICDVDHFKSVNDAHGHAVGDQVLASFGRILKEELRGNDVGGRYGGDEFCLLFFHTRGEEAVVCLERIRSRLNDLKFEGKDGQHFQVAGSFGVVELSRPGVDAQGLLAEADLALYQAKEMGRNCVVLRQI